MSPPRDFCIRTVTVFLDTGADVSASGCAAEIERAAAFLQTAHALLQSAGYEVQTLRIATRALATAVSGLDAAAAAASLERLCLDSGVSFLSLGGTSDVSLLRDGCFSRIAAATDYTSCTFSWQPGMGHAEALLLAETIHGLAEQKPAASFRFGVSFNCQPGIPFFPAAAAPEGGGGGFAIGTENSPLLHRAFRQAAAECTNGGGGSVLDAAQRCLRDAMAAALGPVEQLAQQLAASSGRPYLGLDASIAPALQPPSIPASYEVLGLGRFGGAGTLAISERITAALKSLPLTLCGYSGLMLPVAEDSGLAAAADEGRISIGSLLHYSAVCGCGLDTVPVPGATAGQPAAERRALLDATAALVLDVAALAFRLNKPLSLRLLPVPGAAAGQRTTFDSPYLLNCAVMPLS